MFENRSDFFKVIESRLSSTDFLLSKPEKLKSEHPNSILILPWNLISELKKELNYCKLYKAIPKLTLIDKN